MRHARLHCHATPRRFSCGASLLS
ncbi:hypothetical protein SPV_2482 [Streptococcus pneumoniae]|nr:hypothetical protein SPV_2482 [Streptococcus pneumoniae]